jgi:hypothetical protein
MDLGTMVDKIKEYDEVLTMFEFKHKGAGDKLWSIQHKNGKGHIIETRNSEWTLKRSGREWTGKSPDELKRLLLGFLTKKELIDLVMW